MEWNNRQSKQKLVLDQRQQIQRILSHFQYVILPGKVVTARAFVHNGISALTVNRQNNRPQTTLAYHFDVNVQLAADDQGALLITSEMETNMGEAFIILQSIGEPLQLRQLQVSIERCVSIGQLARINVRRYRSFQHKRGILGSRPGAVKGIPSPPTERMQSRPRSYI